MAAWTLHFFLLLALPSSLWSCACHALLHHPRREFIELPTGPAAVAWIVQLSDLHFSSHYPNRSLSFTTLLPPLLSLINPSLVLITGDLTDGKTKNRATMRQDEAEWVQYKEALDAVITQSGLPPHAFFDLRGNHDKFGVPEEGGHLDYFSKYSISAQQNRTDRVQSVTLMNGGWKHLFVGLDNSMDVGLRGPCNLFGHARDDLLQMLDRELGQWDAEYVAGVSKIVYGHFTTSFIAGTQRGGQRPEDIFAKHNISTYLCGHLHCKFGRNLFKHHLLPSQKPGEFWEWEMGDWKENRVMRIVAIDEGHVSFLDVDLADLNVFTGDSLQDLQTIVFPTYPLDARKMQRVMPSTQKSPTPESVRALVFSHWPITSVKAKIYDSVVEPLIPVEELKMQRVSEAGDRGQYFVAVWNVSNLRDPSRKHYFLQIVVLDSTGKETESEFRPFSVNGIGERLKWTWMEFLMIGIIWDVLYQPLLWSAFIVLLVFLFIPKLCYLYLVVKGNSNDLNFTSQKTNSTNQLIHKDVFQSFLGILVRSCESHTLWWGQLFLVLYLMFFPWFWGVVLAGGYPDGCMSIWGWSVEISGVSELQSGLGVPDVMVIVLPYVYQVLLPLFMLVFALSAESSFVQLHAIRIATRPVQEERKSVLHETFSNSGSTPSENKQVDVRNQEGLRTSKLRIVEVGLEKHDRSCKLCKRWIRKALLVGCLGVAYLHAQQTRAIVGAYGLKALLVSPGFAWPAPVLLVAAVLQTSTLPKS